MWLLREKDRLNLCSWFQSWRTMSTQCGLRGRKEERAEVLENKGKPGQRLTKDGVYALLSPRSPSGTPKMAPLHLCLNSYIHMTVRVIVNVHEDSGIFSFVTCHTCTFPPSSTQAQTRDLPWPPTREQSDTCPSWVAASTASAGHYRGPARCSGNRGSSHCRAPPSS